MVVGSSPVAVTISNNFLLCSFNDAINKSCFPTALKQANITHVFKKAHKKTLKDFKKKLLSSVLSFKMLEKWKSAVDKGKLFAALLKYFLKVFHCFFYDLLIVKLHA